MGMVLAVANEFINLAKEDSRPITSKVVQQLVFIAYGFSMTRGLSPVINDDDAFAWQFGPTFKTLHEEMLKFGDSPLVSNLETPLIMENPKEKQLVQAVWNGYGSYRYKELARMTNANNGAWEKTWKEFPFGVIPREKIKTQFEALLKNICI